MTRPTAVVLTWIEGKTRGIKNRDHHAIIPEFWISQDCRDLSLYVRPDQVIRLGVPAGRYDHCGEDQDGHWIYRWSTT